MNKINDVIEKHSNIIFCIILLLAMALNVYKLGIIPKGIHVDEAGMTYDAWCIANYRKR